MINLNRTSKSSSSSIPKSRDEDDDESNQWVDMRALLRGETNPDGSTIMITFEEVAERRASHV